MPTKVSTSLIETTANDNGKVLTSNGSTLNWANSIPAGTLITYAGAAAPTGYLACPTSATTVSRATYADLFAAIGTTWGAGDGSTTFNIPWFTTGFAMLQANSNVGTSTTGEVISHSHVQTGQGTGSLNQTPAGAGSAGASATQTATQSTGGTNNLAAGRRVLFCVKF